MDSSHSGETLPELGAPGRRPAGRPRLSAPEERPKKPCYVHTGGRPAQPEIERNQSAPRQSTRTLRTWPVEWVRLLRDQARNSRRTRAPESRSRSAAPLFGSYGTTTRNSPASGTRRRRDISKTLAAFLFCHAEFGCTYSHPRVPRLRASGLSRLTRWVVCRMELLTGTGGAPKWPQRAARQSRDVCSLDT